MPVNNKKLHIPVLLQYRRSYCALPTQRGVIVEETLMLLQGSHSDWKTWKNGKAFSSQGKVREF